MYAYNMVEQERISIHASAREATDVDLQDEAKLADFNPRLREGGDLYQP